MIYNIRHRASRARVAFTGWTPRGSKMSVFLRPDQPPVDSMLALRTSSAAGGFQGVLLVGVLIDFPTV